MAGDAKAKITFQLENADEVLQILRQLQQFVQNIGGMQFGSPGGAASPMAPGVPSMQGPGATAAPPGMPPAPLAPGSANPGGNPNNLPQNQHANSSNLWKTAASIFGGATAYHSLLGTVNEGAGSLGRSVAQKTPFYFENLVPGISSTLMTTAGAGIGFALGGPGGALIGAGVGSTVGGIYSSYLQPIVESRNANRMAREVGYYTGYAGRGEYDRAFNSSKNRFGMQDWSLSGDVANTLGEHAMTGRALPMGAYDVDYDMPLQMRRPYLNLMQRMRFSESGLRRFGIPGAGDEFGSSQRADLLNMTGNEDPELAFQGAAFFENYGMKDEANRLRSSAMGGINNRRAIALGRANTGLSAKRLARSARYGGSKATAGAYLSLSEHMIADEGHLRTEAARRIENDPDDLEAKMMLIEAEGLGEERFMAGETVFGVMGEENSAMFGLRTGRASRSFQKALFGGKSAGSLPWEGRRRALTRYASDTASLMKRRKAAGMLSPAMEAQMTEQIEALGFEATHGISREKEELVSKEMLATSDLANARRISAATPGLMRGSAVDQASGQAELQDAILRKQQSTLEEILRISKELTNEQRLQLSTQIENLKTDRARLSVAADIGKASAKFGTAQTGAIESTVGPSTALIRGAGGSEATAAMSSNLGATDRTIAAKQTQIQELLSSGLSPDHPDVQNARRELAGMRIGREQQMRGMAVNPMDPGDRARRSDLSVQSAFLEAGYGSWGDLRGNLAGQIRMSERRIEELDKHKTSMQKAGTWTKAMDADHRESRNAEAMTALGLALKFSDGWLDRMISQAHNMPAQGRIFMHRFTRREAAAAGVFDKLMGAPMGGSEAKTREAREMFPQLHRALGSGDPSNFIDRALGGPERGMRGGAPGFSAPGSTESAFMGGDGSEDPAALKSSGQGAEGGVGASSGERRRGFLDAYNDWTRENREPENDPPAEDPLAYARRMGYKGEFTKIGNATVEEDGTMRIDYYERDDPIWGHVKASTQRMPKAHFYDPIRSAMARADKQMGIQRSTGAGSGGSSGSASAPGNEPAAVRTMYPNRERAIRDFAKDSSALDGGSSSAMRLKPIEILLRVKIEDSAGKIRETSFHITNTKTALDVNVNSEAQRRASG